MLIRRVRIANFRSICDAELDCDRLTALLGRNGAGKSNFLRAIDTFYDITAPTTAEDFFNHDTNSPVEIRVTYGDLSPAEEAEFAPYVRDGTLTVTKRISFGNARAEQKYYAAAEQVPRFAEIRGMSNKTERRKAWKELVDSGTLPGLVGTARSADEVEELMRAYEQDHPELLEVVEREEQFFGPRNIGGGKLDKFTKFVLVPAVREASEEVGGRRGAIAQILDTLVLRKLSAREDVRAFQGDFETRAKELFGPATEADLAEVATSLTDSLSTFAPGSRLHLSWGEVSVPEIQPPAAKVTLVEDEFEGDIERKGHGLQRALVLTLLRELAMLAPAEETGESDEKAGSLEGSARAAAPDLILAIEEPELFLHPSRCRYLSRLLFELASAGQGTQPRNQILYTTHSPYLVDLHRFDQVRMVRKVRPDGAGVQRTTVTKFSLDQAAQELARMCDEDPAAFTRESFAARALPVMTHIVNEGFFADVAVLVEGPSEVGALWKLQEAMDARWDERGIALIPVGGKPSLDRPTVIFRGLSIPTYFVFDADRGHRGTGDEENTKKANQICLRLAGAPVEDFPGTQEHGTWAVLEENFEALLRQELGHDELTELLRQVADELGYGSGQRVLKNVEGSARMIELARERGLQFPTLERIVESVTALSQQ